MAHADVGIGHVPGLHGLRVVPLGREVPVDDPLAVPVLDVVDAAVALDLATAIGAKGDDPRRVGPAHLVLWHAMRDDVRPLPIDVDIVACRVEVPAADPGRPTADL